MGGAALAAGGAVSAVLFGIGLGVRPDIGNAVLTWRFLLKLAIVLMACAVAFRAAARLARPDASPPRVLAPLGAWLLDRMRSGRFRELPLPLAAQLLIGPMAIHMLSRPAFAPLFGPDFPTTAQAVDAFTEAFLRAVSPRSTTSPDPTSNPDPTTGKAPS